MGKQIIGLLSAPLRPKYLDLDLQNEKAIDFFKNKDEEIER